MPLLGSVDIGAQRVAAAMCTQQGTTPVIAAADPFYEPEALRILGMSRITVAVTQNLTIAGGGIAGPPSTVDVYYSQRTQNAPDIRFYGTIIIGALGFPEIFTFHIAARLLILRFNPALLDEAQYGWNVHATGTS
jgi:hypothetical protein